MGARTTGSFIDPEGIRRLIAGAEASPGRVREVLAKARLMKGLGLAEAAVLLEAEGGELEAEILRAAGEVKEAIYGRRMVLFAPLYIGNRCSNECLYCAFRAGNRELERRSLAFGEIEAETRALLREGHKRVLMLSGEDATEGIDRLLEAIARVYGVREPLPCRPGAFASIRRINVEVAPLEVEEFRRLKAAGIGTYACFQESYDPEVYAAYHKSGPKADYLNRLYVMDRAMEGGIDDVGIGALFGLGDWRFEVLGLLSHAAHLEEAFGCGPHTVSVPRIEPAPGAPAAMAVPQALSDAEFRRVVAVLRLALPYTGIILSTRESEALRDELFRYGVSQISAGSRTNPGAYAEGEAGGTAAAPAAGGAAGGGAASGAAAVASASANGAASGAGAQFQLGDHRSLAEVTDRLVELGYVPSFCTGCYRKGRVGADFMDLAKPGLIKRFCEPNALFTYAEYLRDFRGVALAEPAQAGAPETGAFEAAAGAAGPARALATRVLSELPDEATREKARAGLAEVASGGGDVYL